MKKAKFLFHEPLLNKATLNIHSTHTHKQGLEDKEENSHSHSEFLHKANSSKHSENKYNVNSHSAHKEHSHEGHFDARSADKRVLLIAFGLSVSMMVVQFIYALATNSLALLSDTLHMFSDAFALILSFLAILATQRLKSEQKTFGYFRLEILVALINALALILSVIYISYEAIQRLINPSEIDAKTMLIVAFVGLLVNALSGFLMFRSGNLENINIRSAFLHIISDLLSSIGVIIGGIVVYFTQLYYIDSILGLLIALLLLRWALVLIKQSVNILLESSPIDIQSVKAQILGIKGVVKIEDLHISQITNKMLIATMHLQVKSDLISDFELISHQISRLLYEKFEIGHCTIEPSLSN
ncbi:cation diffusion facilitator family transporter [Campylobacter troglodytis]|uniref:cation diffusion facilitator family transporter n=1 Tax=Campylobacter troglodytis TaxID=654363 RepID=UPI00115BA145|nr:cation diffusion facilitator family transporter [Campylobacter troglodytis]TQR59643.1 cation transporter [Campylobacter troglodytis]